MVIFEFRQLEENLHRSVLSYNIRISTSTHDQQENSPVDSTAEPVIRKYTAL